MSGPAASENDDVRVLLLHAEAATLSKRVRKTLVRATRKTSMRDVCVEADLAHDHVVVERVPIGRVVDAAPPIRQEGDVTILPVMEEIVVLERRLVLKEEVHFRRNGGAAGADRHRDPNGRDRVRAQSDNLRKIL
jgi:uncharacterized protein (TIGR02271 family)